MRAVKGPFLSAWVASLSLLSPLRASAARDAVDDAYDDEAEASEPRGNEEDEADRDEVTEGGLSTGGMSAPKALGETGDTRSEIAKELVSLDLFSVPCSYASGAL